MNPGSERIPITLTKENENQSWGFRLQGGADFTIPLSVQSVTPGGLAERSGVKAGDAVLSLNERPSDELEHEAAKQMILMAGGQVRLLVQRGAVKVWTPKVTPLAQLRPGELRQSDDLNGPDPYVQRTSLAADKQDFKSIGTGYNRTARPFPGFGGGSSPSPAAAAAPANQSYAPPPVPASHNFAPPPAPASQGFAPPPAPASQGFAPPPAPVSQGFAPPPAPASQGFAPPPAPASQGFVPAHSAYVGSADSSGMRDVNAAMTGLQIRAQNTPQLLITPDNATPSNDDVSPSNGATDSGPVSPSLQMIRELEQGRSVAASKCPVSPTYAALMRAAGTETETATITSGSHLQVADSQPARSVSPTLLAVQELERQQHSAGAGRDDDHESGLTNQLHSDCAIAQDTSPVNVRAPSPARFDEPAKDGEYHYHGYMDHSKQSKSFKLLQQEVDDGSTGTSAALPSGMRSVRAPVAKPPSERTEAAQYNTCKACGTLCVGVYIRVKGEPMHPECYKCTSCGLNLKNQGFYTIAGKLYCSNCAQRAHQEAGGQPQTVYR